jgi:hypothetical protein
MIFHRSRVEFLLYTSYIGGGGGEEGGDITVKKIPTTIKIILLNKIQFNSVKLI